MEFLNSLKQRSKHYNSPFGHCVANPGNDKNFETELDKNINELLQN